MFDQPPLTRKERAESVRKRDVFTKYGEHARKVLDALLNTYADEGIGAIEDRNMRRVQPISDLGTVVEIGQYFGGAKGYDEAIRMLEDALYDGSEAS